MLFIFVFKKVSVIYFVLLAQHTKINKIVMKSIGRFVIIRIQLKPRDTGMDMYSIGIQNETGYRSGRPTFHFHPTGN